MMHNTFSQTTLKDDSKYRPRTYKGFWQFMACHQHTQQGYKNLLRDFNDRGSYGPTTTQQQAHKELLQDLIFQFTAWTDTTASSPRTPAGFTTRVVMVLQPHNSKLTKNSCRIYNKRFHKQPIKLYLTFTIDL